MQPEIHLGPITLQTFGIMFALAFIAAGAVVARRLSEWGKPTDWAKESFQVAKDDTYGQLPEPSTRGAYRLSDEYITTATDDVARQLSRAGVRLAFVLNKALGK